MKNGRSVYGCLVETLPYSLVWVAATITGALRVERVAKVPHGTLLLEDQARQTAGASLHDALFATLTHYLARLGVTIFTLS